MKKLLLTILTIHFIICIPLISPASIEKEEIQKKAIVLAVFGTSYPTALQSILTLKTGIEKAFPGIAVELAFTSEIIRAKWAKRAKNTAWKQQHPEIPEMLYSIKNPLATIANLQDQGFSHIAVQSTHIFSGEEYHNLKAEIEALKAIKTLRDRDKPFKKLILGRPALGEPGDHFPYTDDIKHAAEVLKIDVMTARENNSALVYMGHGNEIYSTGAYVELEAALRDANPETKIFIGNVEGFPGVDRVLKDLKAFGINRITLFPLMVVAGDHAKNDMAGDEEDSWKSLFEANGIEVIPVLRGLGELQPWTDIYIKHLKDAMTENQF